MTRRSIVWALLAVCFYATRYAYGQEKLAALESAYIFNFTQFTQWPVHPARTDELRVCARSQGPLRVALTALNGRIVGDRTWKLVGLPETGAVDCDVLITAKGDEVSVDIRSVFSSDQPILTIAEEEATMHGEAVIRLIQEDDHLRFDINNTEALRRKLVVSSKLLRLARNVK